VGHVARMGGEERYLQRLGWEMSGSQFGRPTLDGRIILKCILNI
jgi:hypothetical protein